MANSTITHAERSLSNLYFLIRHITAFLHLGTRQHFSTRLSEQNHTKYKHKMQTHTHTKWQQTSTRTLVYSLRSETSRQSSPGLTSAGTAHVRWFKLFTTAHGSMPANDRESDWEYWVIGRWQKCHGDEFVNVQSMNNGNQWTNAGEEEIQTPHILPIPKISAKHTFEAQEESGQPILPFHSF